MILYIACVDRINYVTNVFLCVCVNQTFFCVCVWIKTSKIKLSYISLNYHRYCVNKTLQNQVRYCESNPPKSSQVLWIKPSKIKLRVWSYISLAGVVKYITDGFNLLHGAMLMQIDYFVSHQIIIDPNCSKTLTWKRLNQWWWRVIQQSTSLPHSLPTSRQLQFQNQIVPSLQTAHRIPTGTLWVKRINIEVGKQRRTHLCPAILERVSHMSSWEEYWGKPRE